MNEICNFYLSFQMSTNNTTKCSKLMYAMVQKIPNKMCSVSQSIIYFICIAIIQTNYDMEVISVYTVQVISVFCQD